VVGFFFGKQILVLFNELLLEGMVMLGGVEFLLVKELSFNLGKKVIVPGLFLSPFSQISSKVACFLIETASRRVDPTLSCNLMVFLFH
jgi:hypothetical protein